MCSVGVHCVLQNVLQDTITLGIAGKQYEDMSPLPTARDG